MSTWVLRGASTEYAVSLPAHGGWLESVAWGPHGVAAGPAVLAFDGPTNFLTIGDVAAAEYATDLLRPFAGPDLAIEGGVAWSAQDADAGDDRLAVRFTDDLTGLACVQNYRFQPGTDVIERYVELRNDGTAPIRILHAGSAAFCLPTPDGARLAYLWGQWSQEFQRGEVDLTVGRFCIGSRQGLPGHAYAPWLTVTTAPGGPAWGMGLAWPGSWEICAEADPAGMTRVRLGRVGRDPIELPGGGRLVLPVAAGVCSPQGPGGVSRAWHAYQRGQADPRPRRVVYNSWEATGFDVRADHQLALAHIAADLGVETFVVDDGWFVGRHDEHGGLGDWEPDPTKFPLGLDAFIADIHAVGLDFGLWVEPESVSPAAALYAEHPEWIHRIDGRPVTTVRHQYLLDLGRGEVAEHVLTTVDRLLRRHDIAYLKWDANRPRIEARTGDPDGEHIANLQHIWRQLRRDHPHVVFEGCAGGGGRADLATATTMDVLWPSDNTGPLDRLGIQFGFLTVHPPHAMSSWVTDAAGVFDRRPRSLAFRFVTAMAGVLGIGADIGRWTPEQRTEAASWIARYKELRGLITTGDVNMIGGPGQPACAVQYTSRDASTVAVLAWDTGVTSARPHVPTRAVRLPLHGLPSDTSYHDGTATYSGSHLTWSGLPITWTADRDAAVVVLRGRPVSAGGIR